MVPGSECGADTGDRGGGVEGIVMRTNGYWICGLFPNIILNLTFSTTDNVQYFTLFKLDTRRCEKPSLTGHYILHPQPPQPKSCTCFYIDYISILGENI